MNEQPIHAASLADLLDRAEDDIERYEADVDGGGSRVMREAVRCVGVTPKAGPDGTVRLTCAALVYRGEADHIDDCRRAVFFEFVPAAAGLPEDWRPWAALELTVGGAEAPVEVELTVMGARSRLIDRAALEPGAEATLRVDLRELALTSGIEPPYRPQSIRVAFLLPEGGPAGTCELKRLALVGRREPGPVLDRYGQRIRRTWPGKVRTDADLERARDEETEALASMAPPPDRGRYGGWTGGPTFDATGFFRVERTEGGRWWYVDPDGLPFWSYGPTCIRMGHAAIRAGREDAFAELDPPGPPAIRDAEGRVRFYGLNIHRKYGSREAWAARMAERLPKWACNTVANWSDPIVFGRGVAYVRWLSSRNIDGAPRRADGMPDVFDPAWETTFRAYVRAEAGLLADDPWLLGYFVDNEMPWKRLDDAEREPYARQYFATIRRVLREIDPNHLYLGCRFVRTMPDPAIPRIAGEFVDVLSVNAYSLVPRRHEFDAWYAEARRPIQIGEHQWALRDPRGLRPPWMTMTPDERRASVIGYAKAAAELPYCIGAHWFQFQDQPATGRPSNGENMLIGLVDITDRPYPHMVEAFRTAGEKVFAWHAGSG